MSRRFTRNIKDTVLTGVKKEPLSTNVQNDLLSDGENVAIRNGNEYHILTDNIKEITSPDFTILKTSKNSVEIKGEMVSTVFPYISIRLDDNILTGLFYWNEKVPRETLHLKIKTKNNEIVIELIDTGEENYYDFSKEINSEIVNDLIDTSYQVFLSFIVKEEEKQIGNFTINNKYENSNEVKEFEIVSGNEYISVEKNNDTFTLYGKASEVVSGNEFINVEKNENTYTISGKKIGVTSGNNVIEVTEDEGCFKVFSKELKIISSDNTIEVIKKGVNEFDIKGLKQDNGSDTGGSINNINYSDIYNRFSITSFTSSEKMHLIVGMVWFGDDIKDFGGKLIKARFVFPDTSEGVPVKYIYINFELNEVENENNLFIVQQNFESEFNDLSIRLGYVDFKVVLELQNKNGHYKRLGVTSLVHEQL